MKTEQEIREKAKRLFYRSFMVDDNGNNELASSMQARADLLLDFVLEYNGYEKDAVWEEALDEYSECRRRAAQ